MQNRQRVSKTQPQVMEQLATELRQLVTDQSAFLELLFCSYKDGKAGAAVRDITENLFEGWCAESGTAPMDRIIMEIQSKQRMNAASAPELSRFLSERGFPLEAVSEVADALAAAVQQQQASKSYLKSILWRLYRQAIHKLCIQTGHVIVARILLYRIGEDSAGFPVRVSGQALASAFAQAKAVMGSQTPAMGLLERLRSEQESFLPLLYRLGEFDWWLIPTDKRSAHTAQELDAVSILDKELDLAFRRCFRALDNYQFADVDVDVWRNVYQHYLPWEERQRLGGFYTPDELVELVLDQVGYDPDDKNLAAKTLIDLSCGSGAFIVGAPARLLRHLAKFGPPTLPPGRQPSWIRAEHELRAVQNCLHAVDIHPFAAFLTTLNILFLVLSRYKEVRVKNPGFVFEPVVMAHDSLMLTPAEIVMFATIRVQANGRVKRANEDQKRYTQLLKKKFDFVIGNPPWSGLLKGPLAAVYDELQKEQFKASFPAAAVGKYDIYGLFMERSLRFLKTGGRFGLVTQDTYVEKQWAGPLRRKLTRDTTILTIIDLNPCGNLFFHAMNTPAITILENSEPQEDHEMLIAVVHKPTGVENLDEAERRTLVMRHVRSTLAEAQKNGRSEEQFVEAFRKPQGHFAQAGQNRWNLARGLSARVKPGANWVCLAELFETPQGVTPGGEGCLDLFLMDEADAKAADIEGELIHPVVKGLDIARYCCKKTGKVILYPYTIAHGSARPAFDLAPWKAKQQQGSIPTVLRTLEDALDFSRAIDTQETGYRGGGSLDDEVLRKLLKHREALGLVQYPKAAAYLVNHYKRLEGRVFEKKPITEWGKRWYEYHRPRDIASMLKKPKIISPRLSREVRFTLDRIGIIPQDSAIALVVTSHTEFAWRRFKNQVSSALGRQATDLESFQVTLAFANSEYAQEILVTGRRPTPKGSYQITEDFLRDVQIPPLPSAAPIQDLIDAVETLTSSKSHLHAVAQTQVNAIVEKIVSPSAT